MCNGHIWPWRIMKIHKWGDHVAVHEKWSSNSFPFTKKQLQCNKNCVACFWRARIWGGNHTEEFILNVLENRCVWASFLAVQTDVGIQTSPLHGRGIYSCVCTASGRIFCAAHRLSPSDDGKTRISFVTNEPHRFVPRLCPWWSQEHSGSLHADAIPPKPLPT